eukprot:GHUV01008942.1.p1 GENE.GHUV01008942.1~~GHUV01008942.1.p1  ORF type:complete len:164 (+),score=45.80 GHUV01008942.1:164-655(+)
MTTERGTEFYEVGLEQLRQQVHQFATERDWQQYHTPRNLLLALTGEVGELAEIFQWRGEVPLHLPTFTAAEKQHVGEELSDVLIYLIRMSDVCGIDLGQAVLAKLAKNAVKYPVDKCKGSSAKYTAYQQHGQQQQKEQQQHQREEGHTDPPVKQPQNKSDHKL